jgi:hypothetical protein
MKKLIVLAASRLFPGRDPIKITRRFAVATVLAIAVAVVLGAPAPASAGQNTIDSTKQLKLHPPADSPSLKAIGTVTVYYYRGVCEGVSVSVSKLAPNASYYMPVTSNYGIIYIPIQTDARGNGRGWLGGYNSGYWITSQSFQVYDASGTLVLTSNR